jgi:hypothetical protein
MDTQDMSAKWPKRPQPAGEHDDLLMLAGAAKGVEHALDAVVIAIDERVVEDDGHDLTALGEHGPHREAHEHRDLLLSAIGKALE